MTEGSAGQAGTDAPATVVIGQPVVSGRKDEFRRWQEGVNRAVASFPGFLGTEVAPPAEEPGEWTIIYRFDSTAHLEDWLQSPTRRELLERGADLFAAQASQQVLTGQREEEPVAVVVSHRVDPTREEEFVAWQQRMTEAERAFPGFQGSQLFRPVPGVQDSWTVVYRFDTNEHLDRWLESHERAELLAKAREFKDFDLRRIHPFGSWFSSADGGADGHGPPPWKSALSVLVGLYSTVVLLTLALNELWPDGDLWASLLLGTILSVTLLTWVVMPGVTRALAFWLAPEGPPSRRIDALGAVASAAFLAVAAVVFWLVTAVI
jgi:antibiotic biosynthesis monooxygenase (ABM) superfamily enzyme